MHSVWQDEREITSTHTSLDLKQSSDSAVTTPWGSPFQSGMVLGKNDICLYFVLQELCKYSQNTSARGDFMVQDLSVPCLLEIFVFVWFVAVLCQCSWFSCRSGPWRQSATCGLLLSILFWGSNLLLQCGNVEPNPGPPKAHTMRQTIRHDETDN